MNIDYKKKVVRYKLKYDLAVEFNNQLGGALSQYYVNTERDEYKADTLDDLIDSFTIKKLVLFCTRDSDITEYANFLQSKGKNVYSLYRRVPHDDQALLLNSFRNAASGVLISTYYYDKVQVQAYINAGAQVIVNSKLFGNYANTYLDPTFPKAYPVITFITGLDQERLRDEFAYLAELPVNFSPHESA